MVKVPVGERVMVDLWNERKNRGMIKYFTHTMDLVRAESEFDLKKGDKALVVESHDSFVVVVPENKYTAIIGDKIQDIDHEGLSLLIYDLLNARLAETGGILTFEEVHSHFKRSPIQNIIDRGDLKKAVRLRNLPFDRIKKHRVEYLAIKPEENLHDKDVILKLKKEVSVFTLEVAHKSTGWPEFRVSRMLTYLVQLGILRWENSYRTGNKYYFVE